MKKDYSNQLTTIIVTLSNINDYLRKIEDKLSQDKPNEPQVFKHIVSIKQNSKTKENESEKVPK